MSITIVTAFPDLVESYLGTSVLGRGIASGAIDVRVIDLRDFAEGDYRQIDDYCFGGGGMVLMAEPLARAVESIGDEGGRYVVFPSPQGVALSQELVEDLAERSRSNELVIVCGHYEGADERFVDKFVDLEVSLGDFVITGGELPAMAIIDAIARLEPGVVGNRESVVEDSFYRGLLDNAHYTRPAEWRGEPVPEVLTSGDHAAIEQHRRREAVVRTLSRRPDAIARASITKYLSHGTYVLLSLERNTTEDDILDIARVCRTFGVKKFVIIVPSAEARSDMRAYLDSYADLTTTLFVVKTMSSVDRALEWIRERERTAPYIVSVTYKKPDDARHWTSIKRDILMRDDPAVFVFGNGVAEPSARMYPMRGSAEDYNSLSVRSAVGIVLDRFFGWR